MKALQRARANINAGNPAAALGDLEKTIQKVPTAFEAWQLLGHAKMLLGDHAGAEACFKKATMLQPKDPDGWINLGICYSARQMYEAAIPAYLRSISTSATPHPDAVHNLGSCYLQLDRYEEAIKVFKDLVYFKDTHDVWTLLGMSYQGADRYPEALSAYLRAMERGGSGYSLYLNIGTCYDVLNDPDNAARYAELALEAKPGDDVALYNLGAAHAEAGRLEDAIRAYEQSALPAARYSRAMAFNYLDPADPIRVRREHEAAVRPLLPDPPAALPRVDRADGERLRLGLVSHDFRHHPVAFFLEGLLSRIDRTRYELYFYSDVRKEDEVTARFRAWGDAWRDIFGADNGALAQMVAADRIHILVDLAGHTNGDRLAAFANRLAPVQASYLGYSATTGLPSMDYLLADEVIAPAGQCEDHYTERLVRLGRVFATYTPPASQVPVAAAPMLANGYPTFGSFAQLRKISPSTVRLWVAALQALPQSRLLVMSKGLDRPTVQTRFLAPFIAAGIDPARFQLRAAGSMDEYLAAHGEVDLILDTSPWSGHTTTLHALWMGVPTVTVSAGSQAGRFGEMVLRAAGMERFVVDEPAAFGARVAELLADRQHIDGTRRSLRDTLLASELCDHAALARRFESACDAMWRNYVAGQ